jgi:hypothetical protein
MASSLVRHLKVVPQEASRFPAFTKFALQALRDTVPAVERVWRANGGLIESEIIAPDAILLHRRGSGRPRGRQYAPARPRRHSAPNQPFGSLPIKAKLVEDGIGLADTVRFSVVQHRQRLSGASAAFNFFPVEKFGHGSL